MILGDCNQNLTKSKKKLILGEPICHTSQSVGLTSLPFWVLLNGKQETLIDLRISKQSLKQVTIGAFWELILIGMKIPCRLVCALTRKVSYILAARTSLKSDWLLLVLAT